MLPGAQPWRPSIGLDLGASEAKAGLVCWDPGSGLCLGAAQAQCTWPAPAGFVPLPLEQQRAQAAARGPELAALERQAACAWIECAAQAVAEVARASGVRQCLLGVCAPGLKTRDGRGLEVVRNAPRAPAFADELEAALGRRGLTLEAPITRLSSDGLACGTGELLARDGALRNVRNAWYLGGGTGCPEALLLDGELQPLERCEAWFPRAWSFPAHAPSYEERLAPARLNARFAAALDWATPLREGNYPEQALESSDPRQRRVAERELTRWTDSLSELIELRIEQLAGQRRTLERIVLGQRLGQLVARAADAALVGQRLRARLGPLASRLTLSRLRAAPVLGAVALELEARAGMQRA